MTYPPPGNYGQPSDPNQNYYGQYDPYGNQPHTAPPYGQHPAQAQHPMTGAPTPMGPAYGYQPQIQMPGERPQQATVAGLLIVGIAVLLVSNAIIAMSAIKSQFSFANLSLGTAFVAIFMALGYIALSIGVQRGREGGRITAFVLLGLNLICAPVSLTSTTSASLLYESWYVPISVVVNLIQICLCITTIVLLAVPASTAWYKANSAARKAGLLR